MIATSFYDNTVNEYRLGEVNLHLSMSFVHAGKGRRSQNRMLYQVNRAKERAMDYRQMQRALAKRDRRQGYEQYMRDTAAANFIAGQTSKSFNPASIAAMPANDMNASADNSAAWNNAAKLFARFADAMNSETPTKADYLEFISYMNEAANELGSEEFLTRIRPLITAAQSNDQAGFVMIMEELASAQTLQPELKVPQPLPLFTPSPFMRAA